MKKPILVTALSGALLTTVFACSHRTIDFVHPPDASAEGPSFSAADSSVDGGDDTRITYCPSNRCTNNTATCPGSVYPCDVDLMTDIQNCGACGASCGLAASSSGAVLCSNGQCVLACGANKGDCNGSMEDGCETDLTTNDNCNACGAKCTDPAHPCRKTDDGTYQCGCPHGLAACLTACWDLTTDDKQCGACGNACDPTGGGAPSYPNMYYGCLDSTCDKLKCKDGWGDCNGNIEDGCETELGTEANCTECGSACDPGQTCGQDSVDGQVKCLCPPGLTLCAGACIDVLSDWKHCGGCNNQCNLMTTSTINHGIGGCVYGECVVQCLAGFGDCNGDTSDNCEAKLSSDPNNCGGCGIHCLPNQACIGGQCAVEPCTVPETNPQ